jgi:hypothetical protein
MRVLKGSEVRTRLTVTDHDAPLVLLQGGLVDAAFLHPFDSETKTDRRGSSLEKNCERYLALFVVNPWEAGFSPL